MAKRIYTVYGVLGLERFQHMRIGRYATLTAATDAAKQHSRYDAACTIVRDGVTVAKFRNGLTTDRIVPPLASAIDKLMREFEFSPIERATVHDVLETISLHRMLTQKIVRD